MAVTKNYKKQKKGFSKFKEKVGEKTKTKKLLNLFEGRQ